MLDPHGHSVQIICFVDADHAEDVVFRSSHTGIIIFMSRAPIIWCSKRQNMVETLKFGLKFIALRIATEIIEGLGYKLQMLGLPLNGLTNGLGNNHLVINNVTIPESPLKKKHVAICYHCVREACATGVIRIAKEDTKSNLIDMLAKNLDREGQGKAQAVGGKFPEIQLGSIK